MASVDVVERVLKSIAAMFGKHPLWVQDSIKMWTLQLEDIEDRDLIIGTKVLLRKTKKLPTVAQLLDVIDANPETHRDPVKPPGCKACSGTGARQMARWWIDDKQVVRVFQGVAGCDCAKGLKLCGGAYHHWMDVRAAWEQNPSTTKVYVGTAEQPILTEQQTKTFEQIAKRKAMATERQCLDGVFDPFRSNDQA